MISDPAACREPNGPYAHVYITIADVQASTNPDATPGDGSFVDLTPGLASTPQQVDLLGQADSRCFLASLNVAQSVAEGNYRQVRIFLTPDSAASTVSNNACGAAYANCVVLSDNSLHALILPEATSQGIVLSAGQIANGGLLLNAGDHPYIDVNFDACSSILRTPDGGYEFSPVLHAGIIAPKGGSITGTVVSTATGHALAGGQVVVALEQKDPATGVDRILMRTSAGANGSFVLCPVPEGTYDLVAVGVDGAGNSYSAGVETGIQTGQLAGKVALVPNQGEGTLNALATTQSAAFPPAAIPVAVATSAFTTLPDGTKVTLPLLPSLNPENGVALTANGSSCPSGSDCAAFSLQLPSSAPNVVACSDQTSSFSQQKSAPAYTAESFAAIPGSGGVADCMLNHLRASASPGGAPLVLHPNQSTTSATMSFTRCE
jgi:hypothetical protein